MIKYSLVCENGHEFDSWFANSDAFDVQAKRGFVECPHCRSTLVTKAIMAPRIVRTDRGPRHAEVREPTSTEAAPPVPSMPQPVALLDERQQALRQMVRELRQKIVENSVDVGSRFPEEARKMHEGETPQRSIHGQATFEEAKALVDDGIPVMPIPSLPEERN